MAYLLAGLALLLVLLLGVWAFANTPPATAARAVRVLALALGLGLALLLLFRGQAILAALPAFLGLAASRLFRPLAMSALWRLLAHALSRAGASSSGGAPGASEVRGVLVRMTLDHASGAMEGEVLEGPLAGRSVSSLSDGELRGLLDECARRCDRSRRLLEAWLDRNRGGDWRERLGAGAGGGAAAASRGPITREEALRLLGLEEGASPEEVRSAHRRLSRRLHPDAGGTDHLAAMVNEARDVLLGGGGDV